MNTYLRPLIIGTALVCVSATAIRSDDGNHPIPSKTVNNDKIRVIRSVPYDVYGEGRELLADIYLPNDQAGQLPTILMIHGGAWFAGNKVQVTPHARYAAENGYAVVAINYRLAPIHKFPAQLEDCQSALRWISRNAGIYSFNLDCIAVYGYSAGGHLACLLGLSQNDRETTSTAIKAIVAGGTPCEFSWIPADQDTLAYWLGGSRAEFPEIYQAASPTCFVDPEDPPVYLFHGKSDRVVPLRSPEVLMTELQKKRVNVSLHVVDGGHMATFVDLPARRKAIEFLDKELELSHRERGQ